ncbi:beta-N-acetylglucosaminidase domain-containing protein [bacterium]|nr:beta-N-acetylglucosaminidase domain-containing protein [bacterium]
MRLLNLRSATGVVAALFAMLLAATPASSEPIDLAPYARIVADRTHETFLGFWPNEREDAAYTIRDERGDTSWKPARQGRVTLTLDFAPLLPDGFVPDRVEMDWNPPPGGGIQARAFSYCGALANDEVIVAPNDDIVFGAGKVARCVTLTMYDAGPAALVRLRVFARELGVPPASARSVVVTETDGALHLAFTLADSANAPQIVRVHYTDFGDAPTPENLIDEFPARETWDGPLPDFANAEAVIVTLRADGTESRTTRVEIPWRIEPVFAQSGVVEGFYGTPWTHSERRAMMRLLGRAGLGLYIYGPKNDPLHRDEWRTPYPDEDIARFAELHRLGERVGVTFSFGISPGKDMAMEDEAERATLIGKLAPFVDAGFRHFTLLLDDIEFDLAEPVDGALGAKHTDLANWLRLTLSDMAGERVAMLVVPTVYSTNRQESWAGGDDYLDTLFALHPDIGVMWTGTETFSQTLAAADLADVNARVGREVVIWDNEHATDGGDAFVAKVYLRPLTGRAPDLVDAIGGLVANPMILGAADRLIVPSYADNLRDPDGYDTNLARARAAGMEGAHAFDEQLLQFLALAFDGNGGSGVRGVAFPSNGVMEAHVAAFKQAVSAGDPNSTIAAGGDLVAYAASMATAQNRLHHSALDPSLVDDLWYPADRLTHEGYQLLYLLAWYGTHLAGAPDPALLDVSNLFAGLAIGDRYQLSLFVVDLLRFFLIDRLPEATEFVAPAIGAPERAFVEVGATYRYQASSAARVDVYGMPGADVFGGVLSFTPAHAGTYHGIVVARDASGYAFRDIAITATPKSDAVSDPPPFDRGSDDDDDTDDDGQDIAPDLEPDDVDEHDSGCAC